LIGIDSSDPACRIFERCRGFMPAAERSASIVEESARLTRGLSCPAKPKKGCEGARGTGVRGAVVREHRALMHWLVAVRYNGARRSSQSLS